MQYYHETITKESLEKEFLQSCQTLKKKSFLHSKEVKAKLNWSNHKLTCLSTSGIERGDILYDPINKLFIEITLIEKKNKKYPDDKHSSYIYTDVCRFKRVEEA